MCSVLVKRAFPALFTIYGYFHHVHTEGGAKFVARTVEHHWKASGACLLLGLACSHKVLENGLVNVWKIAIFADFFR